MALQERYFCSFHQRVAELPLDVRMHYGHPDVLDKLHFLTRGGISKPSKEINLNEDVFAAYNTILREGSVVFREYVAVGKGRMTNLAEIFFFEVKLAQGAAEQCLARDVYRLTRCMSLPRLLSFYYSGLGFYIHQVLVMRATLLLGYLVALLTLVHLDAAVLPEVGQSIGLTALFPLCITLATIIPAGTMVLAEKGVRPCLAYVYNVVCTGAPLYFLFITQARAHFFARTIRHGGARYFVSKRTVSTSHVPLHELFGTYAPSHFYPAVDIIVALSIAWAYAHQTRYLALMWMVWVIALCWLVTPFLYNVQATELRSLASDARLLVRWLRTPALGAERGGARASPSDSWEAWWAHTYMHPTQAGWEAPAFRSVAGLFYAYVAAKLHSAAGGNALLLALVGALALVGVVPWTLVLAPTRSNTRRRWWAHAAVGAIVAVVTVLTLLVASLAITLADVAQAGATLYFSLAAAACALEVLLVESHAFVERPLRLMHRTRDVLLLGALTLCLALLGVLWFPSELHRHLLFKESFVRPSRSCHLFYLLLIVGAAGALALVLWRG